MQLQLKEHDMPFESDLIASYVGILICQMAKSL